MAIDCRDHWQTRPERRPSLEFLVEVSAFNRRMADAEPATWLRPYAGRAPRPVWVDGRPVGSEVADGR